MFCIAEPNIKPPILIYAVEQTYMLHLDLKFVQGKMEK